MTMQDPVADMFIRIKNALAVAKKDVTLPSSKLKVSIAKLLKDEGYIKDYYVSEGNAKAVLTLVLGYHLGKPVISMLKRVSRPSIRVYKNCEELPKILGGLGVAIVSTSQGIMSDRLARAQKQGGEIIGVIA